MIHLLIVPVCGYRPVWRQKHAEVPANYEEIIITLGIWEPEFCRRTRRMTWRWIAIWIRTVITVIQSLVTSVQYQIKGICIPSHWDCNQGSYCLITYMPPLILHDIVHYKIHIIINITAHALPPLNFRWYQTLYIQYHIIGWLW